MYFNIPDWKMLWVNFMTFSIFNHFNHKFNRLNDPSSLTLRLASKYQRTKLKTQDNSSIFPWKTENTTHWIYQNSMLMPWPETTEHTVLLMAQGFRNYPSFCSRPQKFCSLRWNCHFQAIYHELLELFFSGVRNKKKGYFWIHGS